MHFVNALFCRRIVLIFPICVVLLIGMAKGEEQSLKLNLGIAGGKIWTERQALGVTSVQIEHNEIRVTIQQQSDEKTDTIQALAEPYYVKIFEEAAKWKDGYPVSFEEDNVLKKVTLTAGMPYIQMDDLLFKIEDAPYVKNGMLMLPARDVFCVFDKISGHPYKTMWLGGESNDVLLYSSAGDVTVSLQNHSISSSVFNKGDARVLTADEDFDVINDKLYFPFGVFETRFLFHLSADSKKYWDPETATLQLFL